MADLDFSSGAVAVEEKPDFSSQADSSAVAVAEPPKIAPEHDKTFMSQLAEKVPQVIAEWGIQFEQPRAQDTPEEAAMRQGINEQLKKRVLKEAASRITESPIAGVSRAAQQVAVGTVESMRSPEGLALMGLAAVQPELGVPAVITRAAQATSAGAMSGILAKQAGQTAGTIAGGGVKTTEDWTREILQMGLASLGTAGAFGARARALNTAEALAPMTTEAVRQTITGKSLTLPEGARPPSETVRALLQEGVNRPDAEALVAGTKTVKDVVGGAFSKFITPAWDANRSQAQGGHAEAWEAGYNDAVYRLNRILGKEDQPTPVQPAPEPAKPTVEDYVEEPGQVVVRAEEFAPEAPKADPAAPTVFYDDAVKAYTATVFDEKFGNMHGTGDTPESAVAALNKHLEDASKHGTWRSVEHPKEPAAPEPAPVQPVEAKPAEPEPSKPGPQAPAQPAKAAAKAQKEVSKFAATEGTRSAKDIKDELVARLTKAVEIAPLEAETKPTYHTEVSGKRVETPPKIPPEKITIDIPGDGTFTVWNTKENLQGLLARAKRIKTTSTEGPKIKTRGGAIAPDASDWLESSEPTHNVTIQSGDTTVVVKGKPVTIPGHENKSFFLTASEGEFRITEPRTGMSVAGGHSIKDAIATAKERLDKIGPEKYQEAMQKGIAESGEKPPPTPIERAEPTPPAKPAAETKAETPPQKPMPSVEAIQAMRKTVQASEKKLARMGAMVPPPIKAEIRQKVAEQRAKLDAMEGELAEWKRDQRERELKAAAQWDEEQDAVVLKIQRGEPVTQAELDKYFNPDSSWIELAKEKNLIKSSTEPASAFSLLNLRESDATPMAMGRIKSADPARFAKILQVLGAKTPAEAAKLAASRFDQQRAAAQTPAVPPPGPPEPPKEFGMAAGAGAGGARRFGLDMANLWQDIKALWQRRPIKRDMAQLADAMIDTIPANKGREAGKELRVLTQERTGGRFVDNKLARKAAVFVIQAKGDPAKLSTDLTKVAGNAEAEAAIRYAQANWDALQPLADRTKLLLDEQINYEHANGIETEYEDHYVPQRHENILTDRGVLFGETRSGTGSTGFKKAKVFPDYASAIEAGYIPRNLDIADLVEHRVRTGQRLVNRKLWADGLRTIDDPYSGEPIVTDMVARRIPRPDGTVDTQYSAPQGYVVREIIPGVRIAVRQGYVHLFNALTGTSQIRESAVGRGALAVSSYGKHILLLLDTFHVSRTMQTSIAARGKATFNKGLSLLEYSDRALTDAVNHNLITSEMAAWVRTPQPFEVGGVTVHMTPKEVAHLGQSNGLNVGRFGDVLYNAAGDIIGRNPATKWIFEKLTRGAMTETFLSEFGRVAKSNPTMDATAVARQVARDTNVLFGNLQRQSFIKNPAVRDLMQMVFLAPQWVESLARRELRTVSQTAQAGLGVATGQGLHVGTVAKTVGTGLAAYVVFTQLLNYLSRGHSTLENEEENHKLDAFIPDPTGESDGFWLSPLSVFGEITHDLIRYSHTEPTKADVLQRIAENKLGPVGRATKVMATGEDAIGTKLPTTWDRAKEAGIQVIPLPIGVQPLAQAVGKQMGVPGIGQPRPGALIRQAAGSAGFKIEPYKVDEAEIRRAREVNTYIEYWKKQARQLQIDDRRDYIERAMDEADFTPQERRKTKREMGEAGIRKYP